MIRALGRILRVAVAFGVACAAGLGVLLLAGGRFAVATQPPELDPALRQATDWLAPFMVAADVLPTLTLVPAVLVVALGEAAQVRSALYYVAAGGLAIAIAPALGGTTPTLRFAALLATAGFAAGFVYWVLAGRSARRISGSPSP